ARLAALRDAESTRRSEAGGQLRTAEQLQQEIDELNTRATQAEEALRARTALVGLNARLQQETTLANQVAEPQVDRVLKTMLQEQMRGPLTRRRVLETLTTEFGLSLNDPIFAAARQHTDRSGRTYKDPAGALYFLTQPLVRKVGGQETVIPTDQAPVDVRQLDGILRGLLGEQRTVREARRARTEEQVTAASAAAFGSPNLGAQADQGRLPEEYRNRAQEKLKLLFQSLGVLDIAAANRAMESLRQVIADATAKMDGLGERSQLTLKRISTLLKDDVKDAESLSKVITALQEEFEELAEPVRREAMRTPEAGGGTSGNFRLNAFRKFESLSQYLFAGNMLYSAVNVASQMARTAVEVEATLTRIQGILDTKSPSAAAAIGRGVIDNAYSTGTNITESLRAAQTFAQIGANPQEVVRLSRAALTGQMGAGLEPQQATELLIASRNITNGRLAPEDLLDRIARIEARYAVSAQDLSEGIMRVGSLATQMQPDSLGVVDAFDTVNASITQIVERTRISGNQAATALRFIISRLSAPEVGRELQNDFGIRLAGDTPEQMRPLQDILQEISTRYNELRSSGNTVRASQLLTTFAG
ncbi:MAG: phage tail tape measure protein, partial [Planctomycetes bacterium]|nr:phage tail tape measure protein [Planctomycetota bacterium]